MVQPAAKVLVNCYQDVEPGDVEAEFKEGDNEEQEEKIVDEDDNDVVESSGSEEENWAFPLFSLPFRRSAKPRGETRRSEVVSGEAGVPGALAR